MSKMTDGDLDTLEAFAKAATPGPWEDLSEHPDHLRGTINKGAKHIAGCSWFETPREEQCVTAKEALANAAYIAAANPSVVLELIAELRAKNDLLEVYEWTEENAKTALRNELKRVMAERDWLVEHIPNSVCPEGKSECDDRIPTAGGTVGYACLLCWLNAAREAVEEKK